MKLARRKKPTEKNRVPLFSGINSAENKRAKRKGVGGRSRLGGIARLFSFSAPSARFGGVSLIPPSTELKIKLGGVSSGLRPDAFLAHPAFGGIPFFFFSRLGLKFGVRIFFKKSPAYAKATDGQVGFRPKGTANEFADVKSAP